MTHTPGPWRAGTSGDCVVADHPIPDLGGADDVDYYGGHLVAESIAPRNRPIITAAPELLSVLKKLRHAVQVMGLDPVDADYCSILEQADIAIAKAEAA